MKEVFVSWQDQYDWMENICCATGSTCYEAIRSEMADGIRQQHGRYIVINYEPAPEGEEEAFIAWVEEGGED